MQVYSDQGTGKMDFENANSFVALRTVLFPSSGLITCNPGLQLLPIHCVLSMNLTGILIF